MDRDGAPVAGARVEYSPSGIPWFGIDPGGKLASDDHVHTESDGSFLLETLMSTDWIIVVSHENYACSRARTFAGDETLTIRMARTGSVSGRVLFPDGQPARGARIGSATGSVDLPGFEPISDAEGGFDWTRVPPGPITLGADTDGWLGTLDILLGEGEHRGGLVLTLRKLPSSRLRLRILGHDGAPAADRRMYVRAADDGLECRTDARGRIDAMLQSPPESPVTAACWREDGGPPGFEITGCTMHPASTGEVEVRLPAPLDVTVRVRGAGNRAPAASVEISGSMPVEQDRDRGVFTFRVIPGSATSYSIHAPGYQSVAVRDWMPECIDVELLPEARIRGRVVGADGRPRAARVEYVSVDHRGCFDLWVAPDATIEVRQRAFGPLEVAVLRRRIEARPGTATDIGTLVVPAWGTVRGVVRDERGRTAGGVLLQAIRKELGVQGYTSTRADGVFAMRVPLGEPVRVVAWKRDVGIAISKPVRVPADLRLHLVREPRVVHRFAPSMRVATADGFPLACFWERPSSDAAWVLRAVPPGPLRFRFAGRAGRELDEHRLVAPGETVDFADR